MNSPTPHRVTSSSRFFPPPFCGLALKVSIVLGLLAALAPPRGLEAAQPLYAVGWKTANYTNSSVLYRIDDYYTSAPKASIVGDPRRVLNGFAIDPTTGIFYAVEDTTPFTLYTLSPTDGSATVVGNPGVALRGLAFDRAGQLFGLSTNRLYRVNKATGTATQAANPIGLTLGSFSDASFDTNGTLYAATSTNLIRVDTNSGIGTLVGALGTNAIFGLAVDTDGVMYAARGHTYTGAIDAGITDLYVVDKTTGVANLVGQIKGADGFSVNGLSFLGNTNPPSAFTDTLYTAVEIGWPSELNRLYQVQWASNLNAGPWFDLGLQVLGNGATSYVFDSTRGVQQRFYRVQALQ